MADRDAHPRATQQRESRRSLRRLIPLSVALAVGVVAVVLVGAAGGEPAPVPAAAPGPTETPTRLPTATPTPSATPPPSPSSSPSPSPTPEPRLAPDALPVSVRVPSIGVDAPMIELGLNPDRTLEVPDDTVHTGWYTGRPRPGEPGPAVVVGHVDSKAGPGVFFRLRELEPGAVVEVVYDDGSVATFEVRELTQHRKDAFPTDAVYGPTDDAQLRLITCGGSFDRGSGHYRDNVIAWASLTSLEVSEG